MSIVTTASNILFQGVCIPQRINKERWMFSALCHWFKCGPSQQRTAHQMAKHVALTWEMRRTIHYEVTETVCVI